LQETASIGWLDLVAPVWFLACWFGYAVFADRAGGKPTLMQRMHEYRRAWLQMTLERENRMVDTQIVSVLVQNISFFASAAILLIGGLVAILGAREEAMAAISELPFAVVSPPRVWEGKVVLLILVFVYAFFTFTWSLRQFNYVTILIGAAPPKESAGTAEAINYIDRVARIATQAADYFNKAMRAYYFGLAAMSWFINPLLFMLATAWVVLVVWRREFRSRILRLLGPVGEPINATPGGQGQPSA
jgi:uncharacterized membrane protein